MEIVVKQLSGLGNQLFQYAAGRYYAKRYGASLRLLIDAPQNATSYGSPRPFLLSHFAIETPMQPPSVWDRLLQARRPVLRQFSRLIQRALRVQFFTEPIAQRYRFLEDLPLMNGVRTLFLSGYWQAHQLADSIAEELRPSLAFKNPPVGKNLEVAEEIAQCAHPVSLHIRRGDYTLAAEGNIALPMSYYWSAINSFRERFPDAHFFVFSDDIAFARTHLSNDVRTTFVDHNDDFSSHEDLRLMSLCHHHIIANSSFSWWGAWLNARPDKLVIAPKYWHIKADSHLPELTPPHWDADCTAAVTLPRKLREMPKVTVSHLPSA